MQGEFRWNDTIQSRTSLDKWRVVQDMRIRLILVHPCVAFDFFISPVSPEQEVQFISFSIISISARKYEKMLALIFGILTWVVWLFVTVLAWSTVNIGIPIAFMLFIGAGYNSLSMGRCRSKRRMDGKTVIITGANSGLQSFFKIWCTTVIIDIEHGLKNYRYWIRGCERFSNARSSGHLGMQKWNESEGCKTWVSHTKSSSLKMSRLSNWNGSIYAFSYEIILCFDVKKWMNFFFFLNFKTQTNFITKCIEP